MALTGGCACGATRYRIDGPAYDTGWCHCRLCQKSSGAPAMAFTTCALKDFVIEQGPVAIVRLVDYGERGFCPRCGTSLTIHVNYQKEEIDVACASLDDPGAVTPEFHIFIDQKIEWVKLADGLPAYEGFGIDARGLMPGDRPE
ncbi:GFA family protein [Sphingomonas sp. CGMCC 1.13654]|uniref:GFA family protein n=1 Tax=Sphingomonas chungangi TaxID=2683589 RepID=A0A838LAI7_9SPHN|nr:GFA family protein [Sphingomonas chungangi]MBA2936271.1 GFA family protein [Sphingomonas chungangi]MVW55656.1 GFA family protein [Sphingomonas chungangi]